MTAVVIDHEDIPLEGASHGVVTPMPPTSGTVAVKKRDAKPNVNRPDASHFTQQNLRMWEPMLTLNWSIIISLLVVASCAVLGILIILESQALNHYRIVYDAGSDTDPGDHRGALAVQADGAVQDVANCRLNEPSMANSFHANHTCYVTITLRETLRGRARVFYEIHGYHQHHRRFVSSMDRTQFTDEWKPNMLPLNCLPMETIESARCDVGACLPETRNTRELFPCGIVANTMFNDIFWLHDGVLPNGDRLGPADLSARGAARTYSTPYKNPSWPIDDEYLPVWQNPNFSRIIPPVQGDRRPFLTADYTNSTAWVHDPLDPDLGAGVGLENEHWRVWVETAAMQPFRKAYGFILREDLPAGTTLVFAVQSNFYVRSFAGTKALVISELSWFGSPNVVLGGVFLAVGGVYALFLLAFLVRRCTSPRRLGDASALAWKHKKHA
jgi:hypothetical protein